MSTQHVVPPPPLVRAVARPLMRGWLHAGAVPLVLAAGIVLVCLARTGHGTAAVAVFGGCSTLLFATSAVYHRGRWSPRVHSLLKRADHGNIHLLIAGSYTPVAVLGLPPGPRGVVLWAVWSVAAAAVAARWLWPGAPRTLHAGLAIGLGWALVPVLPLLLQRAGVAVLVLVLGGGLLYTAGGVVYGLRRPDPWPRWFGFHEVFHALTVLAWPAHYVAISLLAYRA